MVVVMISYNAYIELCPGLAHNEQSVMVPSGGGGVAIVVPEGNGGS